MAAQLQNLVDLVSFNSRNHSFAKKILAAVGTTVDRMGVYGEEIKGMAAATGVNVSDLAILNMAYEITGGCTSIVAQDANGKIFHGRNLDFGPFPKLAKVDNFTTW